MIYDRVLWAKFQLEDICAQKTDESIRNALNHLPKDLSETYNRLLSRIVGEGSQKECNKIFRFMAAAKRPLSPEELDEAISVEPCQPYFMSDRLLNDINGIVRWCHGLIALDELDETLQFTHSSVKSFLCGPDSQRLTLPGFHFEQDEVNRQFGEICVTYLDFNDFKTQVVKYHRPEALPDPIKMASHALNSGSPSPLLDKASHLMRRRAKSTLAKSRLLHRQTDCEVNNAVTTKYHLLQYASEFWLWHTTDFSPDQGRLWSLFETLAVNRYGVPQESNFSDLQWYLAPRVRSLREDTFSLKHQALFRHWMSWCRNNLAVKRTLSQILERKCLSFIKLLIMLLAQQSITLWLEAVLSLERHDLSEVLRAAGTEWTQELTLTERSSLLAKVIETNHVGILGVGKVLVELGIEPYHQFVNHAKPTTLLEELVRDEDARLIKIVCRSMVASNTSFERKIAPAGRTALHIAAISRRYIAVGNLLNHGAAVDAIDDDGRTALHLAIKGDASTTDNSDVLNSVSQLLIAGASLDVRDSQGRVPLDYASRDFERPLREQFKTYRTFLDTNKERSRSKITTAWPL